MTATMRPARPGRYRWPGRAARDVRTDAPGGPGQALAGTKAPDQPGAQRGESWASASNGIII
jgi:hypothetical protein